MLGPVNFIPRYSSGMFAERWFYRKVAFRAPKKCEYYLSGAIVEAYEAPNDLSTEFQIVEKVCRAKRITIEVPVIEA